MSTEAQSEKYGPQRQRQDVLQEAARAGLTVTDWVEESISGTDDERAAENRYYDLARRHPGVNVIFSHPNRVGRHVEVTVGIARKIHRLGGTVWIAGVGNLRDKRNWKEFLRDAVDSENEHAVIVYNLSRGKFDKARRNLWPEGRQPYGYTLLRDDQGKSTTLAPHPEHAAVYQQAKAICLSGSGAFTAAQELNRLGLAPPRSGGVRTSPGWSDVQVRRMLLNPRYLGRLEYRGPDGDVTTVTYPALITPGEYAQIRQGFEDRRSRRRPVSRYPALAAGYLLCAACGASMQLHVTRDRSGAPTWARYVCRHHSDRASRAARGQALCTHTLGHRVSEIDEAAWAELVEALTSPAFLAQAMVEPEPTPAPDRRPAIEAEMAAILTRAARFDLPDAAVQAALEPLRLELARLVPVAQPARTLPDTAALAASYRQVLEAAQTLEERRARLHLWDARFVVGPLGLEGVQVRLLSG